MFIYSIGVALGYIQFIGVLYSLFWLFGHRVVKKVLCIYIYIYNAYLCVCNYMCMCVCLSVHVCMYVCTKTT